MSPPREGLFIALEGGEGAGKSTQATMLAQALTALGIDVVKTREPGDTLLGSEIRRLLYFGPEEPTSRAEALLYAADRAQHQENVITPALLAGRTVICDRYVASSLAYQADAGGLDHSVIKWLSSWATGGLWPHLTIWMDIEPSLGLQRARGSGDVNRVEDKELSFHRKVRESFQRQAGAESWYRVNVSAERTVEDIHDEVVDRVTRELRWAGLL